MNECIKKERREIYVQEFNIEWEHSWENYQAGKSYPHCQCDGVFGNGAPLTLKYRPFPIWYALAGVHRPFYCYSLLSIPKSAPSKRPNFG